MIAPIMKKCAAQVNDGACFTYLGPIGAGNYVKMVHNGIEYGDMQLISEVYDVLKRIVGMSNQEMSEVFSKWNEGELSSYLIEITSKILAKKDDITSKGEVVDYVSTVCPQYWIAVKQCKKWFCHKTNNDSPMSILYYFMCDSLDS